VQIGFDTTVHVLIAAGTYALLVTAVARRRHGAFAAFLPMAALLALWTTVSLLQGGYGGALLQATAGRLAFALGATAPWVWLAFVVESRAQRRIAPRTLRLLGMPAAALALAALFAPPHPLGMVAGGPTALEPGLAFWIAALPYAVALLALAAVLLVDVAIQRTGPERLQALALVAAGLPLGLAILAHGIAAPAERLDVVTTALAATVVPAWLALGTLGGVLRPAVAFHEVFLAMNEAALVVAPDGLVLEANPAAARLLADEDLRHRALLSIAPQLEVARRAVSGRHGRSLLKGDLEGFEVSVAHLRDGRRRWRGSVLVVHDERRDREQARRLREDAFRDVLTGIANRRGFEVDVADALLSHRHAAIGIAFIDLDGFKQINDTLGHAAGDTVLITVAKRLESILRDGDTVARLGGDEFALLLPGITPSGLAGIVGRIEAQLAVPIKAEGTGVRVGASIGLASAPRDGRTVDALLDASDKRMYREKRAKATRTAEEAATAPATMGASSTVA
jgi:diguanylate cyclase (GGDEF)-like protein